MGWGEGVWCVRVRVCVLGWGWKTGPPPTFENAYFASDWTGGHRRWVERLFYCLVAWKLNVCLLVLVTHTCVGIVSLFIVRTYRMMCNGKSVKSYMFWYIWYAFKLSYVRMQLSRNPFTTHVILPQATRSDSIIPIREGKNMCWSWLWSQ